MTFCIEHILPKSYVSSWQKKRKYINRKYKFFSPEQPKLENQIQFIVKKHWKIVYILIGLKTMSLKDKVCYL